MYFSNLFSFLILFRITTSASVISTFVDTNCQNSFKTFTGPNGYPDGSCTDLRRNGAYGSFQIISLDPGCAVTIYANDTTNDPCSASPESQALGQLIACYNTTYHYYSIDMCDPAAALSSAPPAQAPATSSHTGAIVGGVVGGVLGLALIAGFVFWILRRRQFEQAAAAQQNNMVPRGELQGYQQCELGTDKVTYKKEAVEVEVPPVELGGQEVYGSAKHVP
ncbi:hypothetical protein SVAN01_02297 [Stagonosporopsis vannaccii]|nr:hypothetical protein SVAN01_02297 [Stagonosporopsis vannaccii]